MARGYKSRRNGILLTGLRSRLSGNYIASVSEPRHGLDLWIASAIFAIGLAGFFSLAFLSYRVEMAAHDIAGVSAMANALQHAREK